MVHQRRDCMDAGENKKRIGAIFMDPQYRARGRSIGWPRRR
jgi:hypothetical protein